MSKFNYKPKVTNKFDGSLTTKNWVEFILNLRNNESSNFGLAYETIKYEEVLVSRPSDYDHG